MQEQRKKSHIHIPKCSSSGCIWTTCLTCPISPYRPCPIPESQAHIITSLQSLPPTSILPAWLAPFALPPCVRPCSQMCCVPAQPPVLSPFHLSPQIPLSNSFLTSCQLFQASSCLLPPCVSSLPPLPLLLDPICSSHSQTPVHVSLLPLPLDALHTTLELRGREPTSLVADLQSCSDWSIRRVNWCLGIGCLKLKFPLNTWKL